jgi:hypothetical protein
VVMAQMRPVPTTVRVPVVPVEVMPKGQTKAMLVQFHFLWALADRSKKLGFILRQILWAVREAMRL